MVVSTKSVSPFTSGLEGKMSSVKYVPILNCETMDIEALGEMPSISLKFVLMVEQDVKPCIRYDL